MRMSQIRKGNGGKGPTFDAPKRVYPHLFLRTTITYTTPHAKNLNVLPDSTPYVCYVHSSTRLRLIPENSPSYHESLLHPRSFAGSVSRLPRTIAHDPAQITRPNDLVQRSHTSLNDSG